MPSARYREQERKENRSSGAITTRPAFPLSRSVFLLRCRFPLFGYSPGFLVRSPRASPPSALVWRAPGSPGQKLNLYIIAGRAAARIINNHTYTFRFKKIIWRGTVVGVGEAARAEVVWIHFAARPPPREFRGATECLCMCVQSSVFTISSFVLYREHGARDDTPLACWRGHPRAQSHGGRRTPLTTARL